jgi:hypothetical protein
MRHDILKGILRRAVHRAGIASALEPPLCRLPSLTAGSGTAGDGSATHFEARGGILMVLPRGIAIADVSVVHPLSTHLLTGRTRQREQQPHIVTNKSGPPMQGWSLMATI